MIQKDIKYKVLQTYKMADAWLILPWLVDVGWEPWQASARQRAETLRGTLGALPTSGWVLVGRLAQVGWLSLVG